MGNYFSALQVQLHIVLVSYVFSKFNTTHVCTLRPLIVESDKKKGIPFYLSTTLNRKRKEKDNRHEMATIEINWVGGFSV